jgi:hypothetical protein
MQFKLPGVLVSILLTLLVPAVSSSARDTAQGQVTRDVVFGEFQTYKDPKKLFTVELPQNWTIKDTSHTDEIILSVADPADNAVVSIHVWTQDKPLTGGAAAYLSNYLKDAVSTLNNYSQGDPKVQKDGSVGIYFKWDEPLKDLGPVKMWGDAFIEQRGSVVGMIVFLIPEEQYKKKEDSTSRLINSFHIIPQ